MPGCMRGSNDKTHMLRSSKLMRRPKADWVGSRTAESKRDAMARALHVKPDRPWNSFRQLHVAAPGAGGLAPQHAAAGAEKGGTHRARALHRRRRARIDPGR